MTGLDTRIFLDTDILAYAADATSEFQSKAKEIIERIGHDEFTAVISPQILFEFYSLITNKKRFKNFYTQDEAADFINKFITLKNVAIIFLDNESIKYLLEILSSKVIADREIFDAAIVTTMLANNVKTIYTANTKHFTKISTEIEVINPFA